MVICISLTLESLFHLVQPGGLIVLDDFLASNTVDKDCFPGARIAAQEFFCKDYDHLQVSMQGTYFMIKS